MGSAELCDRVVQAAEAAGFEYLLIPVGSTCWEASRQAWEMSAKHSDVHLFWGDLPERIADKIAEIREMAKAHGRDNDIGFGMRLQVICREDEKDAWEAADILVRNATERQKQDMKTLYNNSAANQRVQQLAREHGDLLLPHLWTGITRVRPGAGIAVVGNPRQCADTLQRFIDVGCHSFCLSAICMTRKPSAWDG